MKRQFILLLILALGAGLNALKAQEVFNMVMESATRVVNNPTSNYTATRIAQFKRTALTYMRNKAFEQSDSVSTEFLDRQALSLSEFTDLFFKEMLSHQGNERKECIVKFIKATDDNPMWHDTDRATADAYLGQGELTPFSLDTDWEKAYGQVVAGKKE